MKKVKLFFLPHCLMQSQLKSLEEEAKKRNYKVYVVPGGSMVKKILNAYSKIHEIVGVACKDEINLALKYTNNLAKKGTVIKQIQLLKDGCKDTEVNIEEVLKHLRK